MSKSEHANFLYLEKRKPECGPQVANYCFNGQKAKRAFISSTWQF